MENSPPRGFRKGKKTHIDPSPPFLFLHVVPYGFLEEKWEMWKNMSQQKKMRDRLW